MKKNAFTLIELLIVIAVIGLLLGLLFSAVFKVSAEASEKRAAVNMNLIESAIREYRHDNGRWPFPSALMHLSTTSIDEVAVPGTTLTRKNVSKKLRFGHLAPRRFDVNGRRQLDNENLGTDVLVEALLNAEIDGGDGKTKKAYLDLRPFVTIGKKEKKFPSDDPESAYDAWRTDRTDGKGIPLCYTAWLIQCPVCGAKQSVGDSCVNEECNDPSQENGGPHVFSEGEKADKFKGAMPYQVVFNFTARTCHVFKQDSKAADDEMK